MSVSGSGREILFERKVVQSRSPGKERTVGNYQVFHDGISQTGPDMTGMFAERPGPGDNSATGKSGKLRVKEGTYPLATQNGMKYKTIDYYDDDNKMTKPRPGVELLDTDHRKEILFHPGSGFLWSVGCINLCTNLPDASEDITFVSSRRRVISVIEDMKSYLGADFPKRNGKAIPRANAVIVGEP